MKKRELTVSKGIALMILAPIAVILADALITFGIVVLLFGAHPIALATYGVFCAPFIALGVLLVEVILYWIISAIISIIKSIRKHRHLALQN